MQFKKIVYSKLNAKAKEMYNFQKVSAKLADYGFTTMWLNNDWQGADFIAVHADGETDLKVQQKGRFGFDKKYCGIKIYISFIDNGDVYLYPHDKLLKKVGSGISDKTWAATKGVWHTPKLTKEITGMLSPYRF